jgi:hypothetical protein
VGEIEFVCIDLCPEKRRKKNMELVHSLIKKLDVSILN